MNNTPLVTIGIPCYNAAKFIEIAVHSVLNQTFSNFELIITDDGSTDRTLEILRQIKDPRLKLIVDKENHGISYRLNQQIDMAQGKYFVRMDADDIMFPDRVEKQILFLESHPDVDVVGTSAIIIGDDNEILGIRNSTFNFSKPISFENSTVFIHPTVAGKTDWFRRYHYKDEFKGCEDCNLWIRSYAESKFHILEEPLYFYREPLIFKLPTYLYRRKQGRLMSIAERNYFSDNNKLGLFLLRSWFIGIVATFMHYLGMDSYMISKRNKVLSHPQKEIYNRILSSIINVL